LSRATRKHGSSAVPQETRHNVLERENERLRRDNENLRRELTDQEKRIADQIKRITDLGKQNAELDKQNAELDKQNAELDKQNAELERKLGLKLQNSTTSSKPPSSDGLAGKQRPRCVSQRKKSGRKPGGQPGHPGHHRSLFPPERVDQVVPVYPTECRHCERTFGERDRTRAAQGEAQLHQVTELPKIAAHVTEYQCHQLQCAKCGKTTQAAMPEQVRGNFGPELTALIAYLTVTCRMPRRVVLDTLEHVLAIPLSLGSVQKAWEEASEAVAEPYEELARQLPQEPVLNSDETSYRTNGEKRWLWALVASSFVFYKVTATRGAEVLVALLGEVFAGILCSDRYAGYTAYHKGAAQFCWAHFKRNILGVQEIGKSTDAERFCRDALALHARLFRLWHRFRAGPATRYPIADREELIRRSLPIQMKFFALGERYLDSKDKDVRNLATALFVHCGEFFVFIEKEGVEPTNNAVERALRCAVQWRKTSFGSRSAAGETAMARLLTVTRTCRMQNRNSLGYLSAAVRAHRTHAPVPSLLAKASTT
jgi:TolA-binding protein